MIEKEVARRVAVAEERIRKELEVQFVDKTMELEERYKYVLHQPFNRQIKKMKQEGLILAPSTNHSIICRRIE